jgi:hypothetical protein
VKKIKSGDDREKAVYLCWLFHLVGDIHQPLHTTALFSEVFPHGDKGGNLVYIRLDGRPTKLHFLWDGLLSRSLKPGSINRDVRLIEKMIKDDPAFVKKDLEEHKSFRSWALEGLTLATPAAYLDGTLKLAKAGDEVPGLAGCVFQANLAAISAPDHVPLLGSGGQEMIGR